jgi:hypothetical protein
LKQPSGAAARIGFGRIKPVGHHHRGIGADARGTTPAPPAVRNVAGVEHRKAQAARLALDRRRLQVRGRGGRQAFAARV